MIRYFFVLSLLLTCLTLSHAQGLGLDDMPQFTGEAMERVKTMQIAFITNKLGLSPDQSKNFWPLYNQYEDSRKEIRKKYRQSKNINLMTDKELETHVLSRFEMEQELLDLKRDHYGKLKSAISIRQIAQINAAERQFKAMILKEWRQRQRKQRRNP